MKDFTQLVDLASARLGGAVLAANDDFFAPKENLIKPEKPVFIEGKYTDRGKWMDGWETRRRRTPGYDWCILKLGLPGIVRGAVVDTSFFRGNYPEECSLEVCAVDGSPGVKELEAPGTRWAEILPRSPLKGDTQNLFPIASPHRFTHLRFKIYPDGGVARLRVHGEVLPNWRQVLKSGSEFDLVAVEHGGRVVACSDMFFSAPQNLLLPGRGVDMGDGWETRRRRGPGHDWVILQLGIAGVIRRLEVDTAHFKGNYPESCSLEACYAEGVGEEELISASVVWREVLPRTKLKADACHVFEKELADAGSVSHVRFNIYPDGGVSRLRVIAVASREGKEPAGLRWLNAMLREEAEAALLNCCGSTRWARQMLDRLPFATLPQLFDAADRIWAGLDRPDWLEAFARHPKIGEKKAAAGQSEQALRWSEQEQSGTCAASTETQAALAEANRAYQSRFGYIFIVCATGKSAEEMLELLRQRLGNDQERELRIAAEEQRKITRLRLEKLLTL